MLSQHKLLIIEDMVLIALDIQRVLEDAHAAEAIFARDYREAEALVERFDEFDLAIINPPTPTEFEVAARLVKSGAAIVVCSATGTDLTKTPLADAEVVAKPFADKDLLAACERALSRRKA